MEHRAARSAAWGVVAVVFGAVAAGFWVGLASGGNGWFFLPAAVCSLVSAFALYCVFAALAGRWPFHMEHELPPPAAQGVALPVSSVSGAEAPGDSPQAEATEYSLQPIFDQAPPELAGWTKASLKELFAGRTEAQGRKLMEQHVGKPVRVSGEVEGVRRLEYTYSVRLKSVVRLGLFFGVDDDEPRLLTLNNGEKIVVSGQIDEIQETAVYLNKCKLIEPRRLPS